MPSKTSKFIVAAAAAAMIAGSTSAPAYATHQIGHFVAGVALGALLTRPYVARPPGPGYVAPAPAPVYVAPRVCYRKERYFDPYAGWVWRQVQYNC